MCRKARHGPNTQFRDWDLGFGIWVLGLLEPRRAFNRANHAQMAAAPAEDGIERALDVGVSGIRILVEENLGGHQDAVHA